MHAFSRTRRKLHRSAGHWERVDVIFLLLMVELTSVWYVCWGHGMWKSLVSDCAWCRLSWGRISEQASLQGGKESAGCASAALNGLIPERRKLGVLCAEADILVSQQVTCTGQQVWTPVRERFKFIQLNWSCCRSCTTECSMHAWVLSLKED